MGAEARNSGFAKGRDEGLEVALRIIEAGGTAQDIRDEIRFRERTGISLGLTHWELDKAGEQIKTLTCGTMRIAFAASIADAYGFGQKRIQKALDKLDKLTEYLDNGWLYWVDIIDELREKHHLQMDIMDGAQLLRHYSRPECADLWEEPDLIRPEDWATILKIAGMHDGKDKDGGPCVYSGPIPLIGYRDEYEKVEAFLMIQGILLERELEAKRHGKDEEKAKPEATATSKPKPRKRRRRKQ